MGIKWVEQVPGTGKCFRITSSWWLRSHPWHFCLSALSPTGLSSPWQQAWGSPLLTTESSILVQRLLQRRLLIHIFKAHSGLQELGKEGERAFNLQTCKTPALTVLSLFFHQEGGAVSVHASPLSFQYIAPGSKGPVFRSFLLLSRSASCSQAMRIFPALRFFALFDPGFLASISPHFVFSFWVPLSV